MTEEKTLRRVKKALEKGDRYKAREVLSQVLKTNEYRPEYWLWMSAVAETQRERVYCLKKVWDLDPGNPAAKSGLIMLGEFEPDDVSPVPPQKRNWKDELEDLTKREKKDKDKQVFSPQHWLTFAAAGGIVILLLLTAIFFPRTGSLFSPKLTVTPYTWTPTSGLLPAGEGVLTSTPSDRSPIGHSLQATYTPTPFYVNTPHPGYGSYQEGMKAYERGDFRSMLTYLKLAEDQLDTPDILYLVGEAHRHLGQLGEAKDYYQRALKKDPSFSPPYLGQALVDLIVNPDADVMEDLDKAIAFDKKFGQAYIQRANQRLQNGDFQGALADAKKAVEHLPNSHLAHLYRARAYLALGQPQKAYIDGDIALEADINYVPTYLTMGRIYLALGDTGAASSMLGKYDVYADQKPPRFYFATGEAYYKSGENEEKALEFLNMGLERDPSKLEAYLYRGLIYLKQRDTEKAIQDLSRVLKEKPGHYLAAFSLGKAYYQNGNYQDALSQFNAAEEDAASDDQRAPVYYWRATTYEKMGSPSSARPDWQRIVDLPSGMIPDDWLSQASVRLTPSPTPSPTLTLTPSPAPTLTPSPTPTITPTPGPTPTLPVPMY